MALLNTRKINGAIMLVLLPIAIAFIASACWDRKKEAPANTNVPAPTGTPVVKIDPNLDFSKFNHSIAMHQRMPCSICHTEETVNRKSGTINLPGHVPCSGCHVEQFKDENNSMCTLCHTDAKTGAMKSFPAIKTFNASFSHSRHQNTSCTTCHKNAGVKETILNRNNSHATCFSCHTSAKPVNGKDIGKCDTCHAPGSPPPAVSENSPAYSAPFSHARHKMECTACHTISRGGARGNQVSGIVPKMHFPPKGAKSCATCHNGGRAFGENNFDNCKRCHQGSNFRF
ncbi:MAG: cytochrome c3 family protein [Pyrinomonadaceae bacterium]